MNPTYPSRWRTKIRSILFTLFNRLDNNNNAEFHSNGEERFIHDHLRSLTGPVTLFDVGGNIGDYTEILRNQCLHHRYPYVIHVFEPTRSCFAALRTRFGDDAGIALNNVGVSDAASTATIFYDKEQSGFASLYQRDLSSVDVALDRQEPITLQRLDDYIDAKGIASIDFMKIDIEGHELAAFRGLGRYLSPSFIRAIQFEYGGANLDSGTTLRDLYHILEGAGFVIGKIMKHSVEIRPYSSMMENYQYANYVAFDPSLINTRP